MAANLPSSSLSQQYSALSQLASPPLADRGGPLLAHSIRRLEVTPPPLASASIFTLQFSTLSRFRTRRANAALSAWNGLEEAQIFGDQLNEDTPLSIKLLPITSEEQFDRIIAEAHKLEESLVILWMAIWCRKCIYLKPKLEKLAADYYPRVHFYCVDVNSLPQKLINRVGITVIVFLSELFDICPHELTFLLQYRHFSSWLDLKLYKLEQKMPTVQLWRDSEKVSEIIGGHRAWMVVNEVRRMIENDD